MGVTPCDSRKEAVGRSHELLEVLGLMTAYSDERGESERLENVGMLCAGGGVGLRVSSLVEQVEGEGRLIAHGFLTRAKPH